MQIVIKIAEENKIFQYLAIKSIHITKANPRTFFYLICIISSISGAIMSDAMIVIIYMPLVIRVYEDFKDRSDAVYVGCVNMYEFGIFNSANQPSEFSNCTSI